MYTANQIATKAQTMKKKSGIQLALEKFENRPSKLAAMVGCGVLRQHVEHWKKVGYVSARWAPDVERVSGVPCEKLCPDVNWAVLRKPVPF